MQVQAGVARTGKWWGHQHVSGEHVEPDIMIFAKGIASGFPFAGELLTAHRSHFLTGRLQPCLCAPGRGAWKEHS